LEEEERVEDGLDGDWRGDSSSLVRYEVSLEEGSGLKSLELYDSIILLGVRVLDVAIGEVVGESLLIDYLLIFLREGDEIVISIDDEVRIDACREFSSVLRLDGEVGGSEETLVDDRIDDDRSWISAGVASRIGVGETIIDVDRVDDDILEGGTQLSSGPVRDSIEFSSDDGGRFVVELRAGGENPFVGDVEEHT